MDKQAQLQKIAEEIIKLTHSPLYHFRAENNYQPVPGEGSADAHIMFIGEAPGKNEGVIGKPFIGAAGRILDELLHSVNINRQDVFITSIVKDRPPENRDPTPEEIKIYTQFLDRQIDIIQPKVLATLGRFAMTYIMEKFNLNNQLQPIGKIHGKSFTAQSSYGVIQIVPLYHPATALYNGSIKKTLLEDFQILKTVLA